MPGRKPKNEMQTTRPGATVRAGGWILTLVLVGLWIGAGQLWRRSEPHLPIGQADYTVDINQASESDLLNLPEVGPSLAKKILVYRDQHGDFHSLSDLGEVPGVGPQTLKQLGPFLSFTTRLDNSIAGADTRKNSIKKNGIEKTDIENKTVEDATVETILTAQSRERIAP